MNTSTGNLPYPHLCITYSDLSGLPLETPLVCIHQVHLSSNVDGFGQKLEKLCIIFCLLYMCGWMSFLTVGCKTRLRSIMSVESLK